MSPYRVGVIGTGRISGPIDDTIPTPHADFIAPYGHVTGYQFLDETEVVAAADIDPTILDQWCTRYGITKRYADYRAMIEKEELDIVSVTTRTPDRAEPIIFAAEHGVRGIFAEKALCASTREIAEITDACRRNGTHLEYGPMRRFYSGYQKAREVIESGAIGPPVAVITPVLELFNGLGHFVDEALYLLGDPGATAVCAELEPSEIKHIEGELVIEGDPFVRYAVVQFDNGTRMIATDLGAGELQVTCAEGLLQSTGDSDSWEVRRLQKMSAGSAEPLIYDAISGTVSKIRDLIDAIEHDRPGLSNLDIAAKGMEICFAMIVSHHRNGERVQLPLKEDVRMNNPRL